MKANRFLTLAGCACALACALLYSSPARVLGVNANAGASLVQANGCAGCHGANMQGGDAPKLYGIEHRRSAAQIAKAIKNPKAPMPQFPFSDSQIGDLVAYLSALDGGAARSRPVVTLTPAKPSDHAVLTVRFATPPKSVTASPVMQMGGSRMQTARVVLHPTHDPRVWTAKVNFSMGGPWTIDLIYDGTHLSVPVNVQG